MGTLPTLVINNQQILSELTFVSTWSAVHPFERGEDGKNRPNPDKQSQLNGLPLWEATALLQIDNWGSVEVVPVKIRTGSAFVPEFEPFQGVEL